MMSICWLTGSSASEANQRGQTRLPSLSSPVLFVYQFDIDHVAEGIDGAVAGVERVRVTHMLYADNLSFTSNKTDQMQCMLNRLLPYAHRKGLTVNVAKSE
eukprot:scaffold58010_cov18-Tisochrysis_lutea.AAC.2